MKIISVVGARPQFIKAAVVSRALSKALGIEERVVHTGQHFDRNMSDIFFEQLAIPAPSYNLAVNSLSHGAMTGRQLERIERVLLDERPDAVLVYGDTNSTLAGALAGAKLHIPVAHVEAGLRSYDRRMPEEVNRVLTDRLSDLLFAPSQAAVDNLTAEGLADRDIHIVGDVMYDAVLFFGQHARRPEWAVGKFADHPYVLCTIHRAENTDDSRRLKAIVEGLHRSDARILIALHPRTAEKAAELGLGFTANVEVVPPVGYLEMLWLQRHAIGIVTDSGGLQKEAFFNNKPCVTIRDSTEWVELLEIGANTLVPADPDAIANAIAQLPMRVWNGENPYGDGRASLRIADLLRSW